MLLLSPTERDLADVLRADHVEFRVSSLCEANGVDCLVLTEKGYVGYQRKTLPDLQSSLSDGRLYRELDQIRNSSILVWSFLVLEYDPTRVTIDGQFLDAAFTVDHLRRLLAKVHANGIGWFCTHLPADTISCILSTSTYLATHDPAQLRRPGPPKDEWGNRTNRDFAIHTLQSVPGIGPTVAAGLYDAFGSDLFSLNVSRRQLLDVPGLGPKLVDRLELAFGPCLDPGPPTNGSSTATE
jgi:ERCC4-type nuclease